MKELVKFSANSDSTAGYLSRPEDRKGPGLLVIQEWWGLVDHIRDVCDRFAAAGFVALAPDLYHGESTSSPDQAQKLYMALNIDHAGRALRGAADFLHHHPAVSPGKVGVVGFCMGGQLALYAAQEHGDRIACAVDFYGIHPSVPIEPKRIGAPVLGHFGERDQSVPVDRVKALAAEVQAAGGSFEVHFYDAGHAFFNDTRPTVFAPDAAQLAWQRTLDFLHAHLGH